MRRSRNKYNATPVHTNEGKFDSVAEYKYYCWLLQEPTVVHVARQVRFALVVNGVKLGAYVADFVVTFADARIEVHEVKNNYLLTAGKSTPAATLYKYKVKLMQALHGITVKTISNEKTKATGKRNASA